MKIMKGGGKCQSLHHGVIATVTSHFTLLFLVNALKYTKFKVCMAEWLDGHVGSSRSWVETLLE